jgi:hypothetical protein
MSRLDPELIGLLDQEIKITDPRIPIIKKYLQIHNTVKHEKKVSGLTLPHLLRRAYQELSKILKSTLPPLPTYTNRAATVDVHIVGAAE